MTPEISLDELGDRIGRAIERGEVFTFRAAAKLFFVVMVVGLIILSATVSIVFVAVLAGVAASILIKVALPDDRFRVWARGYYTGEAGDRWRRRYERGVGAVSGLVSRVANTGRGIWRRLTP